MKTKISDRLTVWGPPLNDAVLQMENALRNPKAIRGALMADHHLGYSVPIGGVIVYDNAVSPSAVGYDIGCGNTARNLGVKYRMIQPVLPYIMDEIASRVSFGVGRKSNSAEAEEWFDSLVLPRIQEPPTEADEFYQSLLPMAREQFGTVGSGNHYVDIFVDQSDDVWVGVHFGSRGLGHKIATHYIKAGGGKDGINVDPVVLDLSSDLGKNYWRHMNGAQCYADYARKYVVHVVASIFKEVLTRANIPYSMPQSVVITNHHNYAYAEEAGIVVRKGATAHRYGSSFIGGSMGEPSCIVSPREGPELAETLYSTVHGAGRIMSRTEAAGKTKWIGGKKTRVSEGKISTEMMHEWMKKSGVILRGGGTDESPHVYKRLHEVLGHHIDTVNVEFMLKPIGVVMAGENEFDPFKD